MSNLLFFVAGSLFWAPCLVHKNSGKFMNGREFAHAVNAT